MGTTNRTPFTKRGAALTGFATSVVFTLALGATQHDWTTGSMVGITTGIGVFVSHRLAAQPRC
ncbi:hypothetical protein [Actinoplanes sp. L3-i22]|uniref:hypothetical protein n=1 Tax=Actinoplanes sp. L3-i22 TaxID=2836373 RepID=UPI001C7934C1|nr:hypothetical protein [Actinoplanes sp. L3-i22]BCY08811.1 hypothetical protein L3i22_038990 [Actinoplanes sp. L3-i22]